MTFEKLFEIKPVGRKGFVEVIEHHSGYGFAGQIDG